MAGVGDDGAIVLGTGVVGDIAVGARVVKKSVEGAGLVVSVDVAIVLGDGVVGDRVVGVRVIGACGGIAGE